MEHYNFYFDETYHTRKITYRNGKLNLDNDKDFYVGCYIGAKDWEPLQNQLLSFETRQKQKLGISPDKELKSTSLINSNKITYGLHSLNSYAIDFYTELFEILKGNIKIHLYIMNKYEFLFHNIFPNPKFFRDRGVIYKNFMYCLTKFVVLHPQYKICDVLLSPQKDRQKRRQIITILKKHLRKIENIQKKQKEKETISLLVNIFHAIPFHFRCAETIDWDYRASPALFEEFLFEQNIGLKNLYIDNEAKTVEAARAQFEDSVFAVQSEDNIQIRVCDWIACLISRIVLSHE